MHKFTISIVAATLGVALVISAITRGFGSLVQEG